jgi:hypothetical protein
LDENERYFSHSKKKSFLENSSDDAPTTSWTTHTHTHTHIEKIIMFMYGVGNRKYRMFCKSDKQRKVFPIIYGENETGFHFL